MYNNSTNDHIALKSAIGDIRTYEAAVICVKKAHAAVRSNLADFLISVFLLGGAVARGEVYAERGDNYLERLVHDTGVGMKGLRRAAGLYHVFAGDIFRMLKWRDSWIQEHGGLLLLDVDSLVEENRERVYISRGLRLGSRKAGAEVARRHYDDKMSRVVINPATSRKKRRKKPSYDGVHARSSFRSLKRSFVKIYKQEGGEVTADVILQSGLLAQVKLTLTVNDDQPA